MIALLRTTKRTAARTATRPATRSDASGIGLAVAIGLSSALSFGVHALASRQLTVADYGGLAAILALMTAAAVPVGAVQTALTRSAAEILGRGGLPSGSAVLRQALPAALLVVGAAAASAGPVASFLALESATPILLGGMWVAVVLVGAVGKALLIATESHRPVAAAIVRGALLRLVAAAALTPLLGVTGSIAAAVAGDLVASIVYLVEADRRGFLTELGTPVRVLGPDAGRALSAQLSLWLFASLAVVIGRRTLSGPTSGSFAAMATAAVACLFLPQAVATIVFPRFVADGSRRLLIRATALAAAVGMACAALLCVRPDVVFVIFFGPHYRPDRSVLLVLCAHFVLLGCLTVLTQYVVARRQAGTVAIWAALAAAVLASAGFGDRPMSVALSLLLPTVAVTFYFAVRGAFVNQIELPPDHRRRHDTTHSHVVLAQPDTMSAAERLHELATLDVSVVIPTYNGGTRLSPCVAALREALETTAWSYEIIVSVDGSTDRSERGIADPGGGVVVDRCVANRGKGAALRRGFARAQGRMIGFIDGDGDIDPSVFVALVERLHDSGAWVGVASKNQPGSAVSATRSRRVMSAVYRMFVHWMFDLRVTDTQCGCKVFRREFLASTLDHSREDGFALDLELLTIGSRIGMGAAVEVPVVLSRNARSTISGRTAARVLIDTIRIRHRLPQATRSPLPLVMLAPVGGDFSSPLLP